MPSPSKSLLFYHMKSNRFILYLNAKSTLFGDQLILSSECHFIVRLLSDWSKPLTNLVQGLSEKDLFLVIWIRSPSLYSKHENVGRSPLWSNS